jgi:hypothetical protein
MNRKIPSCFLNLTYIVDGVVNEQEALKEWQFLQQYPQGRIEPIQVNNKYAAYRMRLYPDSEWIYKKFTIEDAIALGYASDNKVHWRVNKMSMLATRCRSILYDIANCNGGRGYLSDEELEVLSGQVKVIPTKTEPNKVVKSKAPKEIKKKNPKQIVKEAVKEKTKIVEPFDPLDEEPFDPSNYY